MQRQSETDKLASLNATKAKLKAQFDVLQQAEAALSGYSEGSKAILEDSRKANYPKVLSPSLSIWLWMRNMKKRSAQP